MERQPPGLQDPLALLENLQVCRLIGFVKENTGRHNIETGIRKRQ